MGYINMKCMQPYRIQNNEQMSRVITEMKQVFATVPYGVSHTISVMENAENIMAGEGVSASIVEQTLLAAILHDIGALKAMKIHGSMSGKFQEIEGPAIAREILERAGYPEQIIDRVCYIVGNHHTEQAVDGEDFQILWEADAIENLRVMLPREGMTAHAKALIGSIRTKSGKTLLDQQLHTDKL